VDYPKKRCQVERILSYLGNNCCLKIVRWIPFQWTLQLVASVETIVAVKRRQDSVKSFPNQELVNFKVSKRSPIWLVFFFRECTLWHISIEFLKLHLTCQVILRLPYQATFSSKNFWFLPITSNLWTHACSIKYRRKN
jgi:hypothetical protein